jgi:soluble epoxide hydrolase/lipid-phosphate phosphatase
MVHKLTPDGHKALQKTTKLNGVSYSYILSEPKEEVLNTIFLVHGYPDFSFGWRYQIPFLNSLGLRVVALDMMGYSGTHAPESPSFYTYKRAADDIAELAKQLNLHSIILGGHDWGGAIVYRVAMYYPKLISAFFSVCTPFQVPAPTYVPASVMPNFRYQIQFGGPDLEKWCDSEDGRIRQYLNGMFGGRGPNGEPTFSVEHGAYIENLPILLKTILASDTELDYYASSFAKNGMHGPTNWYRTGELNHEDDKPFTSQIQQGTFKIEMPVLFIGGTRDQALPPSLANDMGKYFSKLMKAEVNSSHWALLERPAEVNALLKEWLVGQIAHKAKI